MNENTDRQMTTVALFFGLPYSGKTALIRRLREHLPGKEIYIDSIFRDIVSEEEVSLARWLEEQPLFVNLVEAEVANASSEIVYVELGIFQRVYRTELIRRLIARSYRIVSILLRCDSEDELKLRQETRERLLKRQPDRTKIAIGLEELYKKIYPVFENPESDEQFQIIDTTYPIEKCVADVMSLIET